MDGLTTGSIGQMVDSKWLERLQGDANGLTKATDTQEELCLPGLVALTCKQSPGTWFRSRKNASKTLNAF